MRYLKTYEGLFNFYKKKKVNYKPIKSGDYFFGDKLISFEDAANTCDDILLDLEDIGYTCDLRTESGFRNNSIQHIKIIIEKQIEALPKSIQQAIYYSNYRDDIKPVIERVESYLTDNGFIESIKIKKQYNLGPVYPSYDFIHLKSDGSWYQPSGNPNAQLLNWNFQYTRIIKH